MKDYGIKSLKQRYIERGWLTVSEAAKRISITTAALRYRIKTGSFSGEYIVVEERRGTVLINPETL